MAELPPDQLNEIGVLKRREIEARILMPVLSALGEEFGRERVLEVARRVIVEVARAQGRELAGRMGGDSLQHFATALQDWKKGDAYRMDVLEQTDERFAFNVTRCRRTQTIMEGASHCDFRFEMGGSGRPPSPPSPALPLGAPGRSPGAPREGESSTGPAGERR